MDVKQQIDSLVKKALAELKINNIAYSIERPRDVENGDYSTNAAMAGFKTQDLGFNSPKELAEKIVDLLNKNKDSVFKKIEVAGHGFINFYLSKEYLQKQVGEILKLGEEYGSIGIGKNQNVSVEYVSANPTGPLHIGNARGGPIGDTLVNVLKKAGFSVAREYLHNDVGGQVQRLGEPIYFTIHPDQKPKNYEVQYQGEYIKDLSVAVKEELIQSQDDLSKEQFIDKAGKAAVRVLLSEILEDCKTMGIEFDKIIAESDLKKEAPSLVGSMQKEGSVKEKDGALWFAPNDEFLKDRETVVRKSDGEYTYFASDIVYHREKLKANKLVIDIWGSNHSGHVPRVQAAVKALGFKPDDLKTILYQYVRIKRGEDAIKMSKRAGNFITAREILEEVGKDAFRFFILMHKAETHMDFDLELAKKKHSDNPVFYVQYAHSRICSIFKKADSVDFSSPNYQLLTSKEEIALIRYLLKLPEIIEDISVSFGVNGLTSYATEIASLFHHFYEKQLVISEDKELTKARLALTRATQITLKNTLDLLGVSAPEKM